MKITMDQINQILKEADLKITPQRQVILQAIYHLANHPTAENIIEYIRNTHPNIATGTVYKVLDVLVDNGLVNRVKTDKDIMRYDGILDKHHHLFCEESERIEDYFDEDLDQYLSRYFQKKEIPGFQIDEIKLQINGRFTGNKKGKLK